jgi:hypothetical protein
LRGSLLEGLPAGESGQHPPVPVRAAGFLVERIQPLAADDRAARPCAAHQQPQHQPPAQGVAAKVIVVEPEVVDHRQPVVGKHVRRVAGRIMRSRAVAVAAQVREDNPVAPRGERLRWPAARQLRPAAEQPVQQHQRAPGAQLAPRQLHSVAAGEVIHGKAWPGSGIRLGRVSGATAHG